MHQRMGFYVAPDGRLLVLGFYACAPATHVWSPTMAAASDAWCARSMPDGRPGPDLFLRYNRHAGWNETNTHYPFYTEVGRRRLC